MAEQKCKIYVSGRSSWKTQCRRNKDSILLHPASHPELKALNRFHFAVIRAVEIPFRGANMRMPIICVFSVPSFALIV
jgi:hypothetical protein